MRNQDDLTGMETWSIVAPILAAHMGNEKFGLLEEAYVMVYCALKYWDESKEKDRK